MADTKTKVTLKRQTDSGDIEVLMPYTTAENVGFDDSQTVKDVLESLHDGHYFTDRITQKVYEAYLEDGVLVFENIEGE